MLRPRCDLAPPRVAECDGVRGVVRCGVLLQGCVVRCMCGVTTVCVMAVQGVEVWTTWRKLKGQGCGTYTWTAWMGEGLLL
nr:hypothetical protein Iba_chr07cCG7860 [Ipomoea batatas]